MTRYGKCEVCRERKVKCDERRPKCGQCMKKNRCCRYENRKPKCVDVNKRRDSETSGSVCSDRSSTSTKEQDINTTYTTRSPTARNDSVVEANDMFPSTDRYNEVVQSFSSSTTSGSDEERYFVDADVDDVLYRQRSLFGIMDKSPDAHKPSLRGQFLKILESSMQEWATSSYWACWIHLIPQRLGRNDALDDATAAFIAAVTARRSMTESNLTGARKAYGKALHSIQSMLAGSRQWKPSIETVAAVNMLSVFEMFLGLDASNQWRSHGRAVTNMLGLRGPAANRDELNKALFDCSLPLEFSDAIFQGRDCVFDNAIWLSPSPSRSDVKVENPDIAKLNLIITDGMIRIPKLVRTVRELRCEQYNISLGIAATTLAEALYDNEVDGIVDEMLCQNTEWMPTHDAGLSLFFPDSISFPSATIFEAILRYCYSRIVLVGACYALSDVFPFSLRLGRAALAETELRLASILTQSVQYAEQLVDPLPLGPMMLIQPLQIAFGSWSRVERDNGDSPITDGGRSQFMKEWCMTKSNELLRNCGEPELSITTLEMRTSTLEGGPVV